mgnify:CR=1 FL=1
MRTEVEVLEEVLRGVWKREDLAEVVGRVEEHEVERLKEVSVSLYRERKIGRASCRERVS